MLAAAMCQVSMSARLHANARCMRDKLRKEDGVAVAVAVIKGSAAVPQPSATILPAHTGPAGATRHDLAEQERVGQVRRLPARRITAKDYPMISDVTAQDSLQHHIRWTCLHMRFKV